MGAEPWEYFVPYQANVEQALQSLREREFQAGRFRGAEEGPSSIDEALEMMDADGTASILDMLRIAPQSDYFAVTPLSPAQYEQYFGTQRPTRGQIEQGTDDLFEELDRGQGVVAVAYEGDQPRELYFAGYSFD